MSVMCVAVLAAAENPNVHTVRVPDSGIQPQVVVAPRGSRHLLYYKGEPDAGDLYYASCSKDETKFEPGIRVNSIPGAACAIGTMRGGQIAFSPDGRIHIAWNGSQGAAEHLKKSNPARRGGEPMLYTRSNADRDAFEPERDLMTSTRALDGGGSVAVARDGRVAVVWHAATEESESKGEAARQLFVAVSEDRGETFAPETAIAWPGTALGACACCGLKATFAADESLMVIFRAAPEKTARDARLLRTNDLGKTSAVELLGKWNTPTCPMSSAAAQDGAIAWETEGNVYWSMAGEIKAAAPAKTGAARKYPSVAVNKAGQVLLAWVEDVKFGSEGTVRWQVFTSAGEPIEGASGGGDKIPAWSLVAAFAEQDGSFAVVY